MAALADADAVVRGLSSEELSAAAGMADRTYRRARQELLESGELELLSGAGGRGNTNVWHVRASADAPAGVTAGSPARRVVPPAGVRPLLATLASSADENRPALTGVPVGKGGQDRTLSDQNVPSGPGFPPQRAVRTGHFSTKPRQKPRQKPRRPTRARVGTALTPESQKTPPAPLPGGAGLTRSPSSRPTPPGAVVAGGARSASISPRSVEGSGCPVLTTAPTGSRFGRSCSEPSARTCSRSGWSRSS